MSASSDVLEMQGILSEIADFLTASKREKDRISAIHYGVRKPSGEAAFGWNRILEFLRARAKRVDSWEKDIARQKRDALRLAEQQRRELEHLSWLASEVGRLRESGEDFHVEHLNALEHVLRSAGREVGSVEVQETANETTG